MRVETIGNCTLYHADCRDVLKTLDAGSIDAVVTDPPYGNNYSTGHRSGIIRSETAITGDIITQPLLNDVAKLTQPLLNDVAVLYWFAAPDRLDMVLPILRRWHIINVLAWDKMNCTAGDLRQSYGKQWEAIVFAVASKSPMKGGRSRDVIRISRGNVSAYSHPTQKPTQLMRHLIAKHDAETILDPFMGSGTVGIAAIKEGRKYIGIEIDEHYFDVACQRIRRAWHDEEATFWPAHKGESEAAENVPTKP